MQKPILILAFLILTELFLAELFLAAGEPFKSSTHIGIHGGITLCAVNFNPSVKQNLLSSTSFGLLVRHVSEPHIGLQVEVNIAGKGWQEDLDSLGTYTRRLETVDIPVTAVFIVGSRLLRFAFTVGPYVSYRRHEKESIDLVETTAYKSYYQQSVTDKWEFGFTGGASIEFHTKIGAFALRATYSHSLTNLFSLTADEFYFNGSRSQVIYGGLMYCVSL